VCNGPTHRLAGAAAWLAVAPTLPVQPWQIAAGAVVAGATANGRLSPDMDQSYYLTGRYIPGGHRGITHFWAVPIVPAAAAPLAGDSGWLLLALAVAWWSHHVMDGIFGRVPVLPRARRGWEYAGVGLRTGGQAERWVAQPLAGAAACALAVLDAYRYGLLWAVGVAVLEVLGAVLVLLAMVRTVVTPQRTPRRRGSAVGRTSA
jgi:hypothetical protein